MKHHSERVSLDTPFSEAEFFIVDVETTGLSPKKGGRVIEIGAVKTRGNAVVETFSSFVNGDVQIEYGAFRVNGITQAMLNGAPPFSGIAERLTEMSEGAILGAYNANFDVSFISSEMERCGKKILSKTILDVLPLARKCVPGLPRYNLDSVAMALQIPFPVQHRALEDAIITAQILFHCNKRIIEKGGTTVADLFQPQRMDNVSPLILKQIEDAVANGNKLTFKYSSAQTGVITNRLVTPKKLETPYLVGFCHKAKAERTFRVEKISELNVVE
ncbi:MAG: WYL domain-containing protein [Ignavibacteriales bacterium]|nr:WYL domain-containing protein [Ignavibacteriales bacterium]